MSEARTRVTSNAAPAGPATTPPAGASHDSDRLAPAAIGEALAVADVGQGARAAVAALERARVRLGDFETLWRDA